MSKSSSGKALDVAVAEINGVKRLVCVDGKYVIWRDSLTHKWKWALRTWADDGWGGGSYGAEFSLQDAVQACKTHASDLAAIKAFVKE